MPQQDHEMVPCADSGSIVVTESVSVSVATSAPRRTTTRSTPPGTGKIVDAKEAAAFFARVSLDLMKEPTEATTMQRIAERAVQVVPGCDHCSISVRRRRHRIESLAATSTVAKQCDDLQYKLEQGPSVGALWENNMYVVGDTTCETRWPLWAAEVSELGIGSVLSIPLANTTESLGALNMYAETTHGFGADDVDLAAIYAMHATNAMSSALLVEGLQIAVQSRHLIGVAQGILMQNYGIGMEQAFEVLRRCSSHRNIKLREVAEHIVENGDLPGKGLAKH